jgi:hypothetical protein
MIHCEMILALSSSWPNSSKRNQPDAARARWRAPHHESGAILRPLAWFGQSGSDSAPANP